MDLEKTERIMVRMAEMQPRVPEWYKAEHMEITLPLKELWQERRQRNDPMINRSIRRIFGRLKQRRRTHEDQHRTDPAGTV